MLENIGSAMLILGSIWLHYNYGLDPILTIILCLWGLGSWLTIDRGYTKLQKKLLEAKIRYFDMRSGYHSSS